MDEMIKLFPHEGNWLYMDYNGERTFSLMVIHESEETFWKECTQEEKDNYEQEHFNVNEL